MIPHILPLLWRKKRWKSRWLHGIMTQMSLLSKSSIKKAIAILYKKKEEHTTKYGFTTFHYGKFSI